MKQYNVREYAKRSVRDRFRAAQSETDPGGFLLLSSFVSSGDYYFRSGASFDIYCCSFVELRIAHCVPPFPRGCAMLTLAACLVAHKNRAHQDAGGRRRAQSCNDASPSHYFQFVRSRYHCGRRPRQAKAQRVIFRNRKMTKRRCGAAHAPHAMQTRICHC